VVGADVVWVEGPGRRLRRWLGAAVAVALVQAVLFAAHVALAGLGRAAVARAAVSAAGGRLVGGRPLPTPLILGYYDGGGVDSPGWFDMVAHAGTLNGIVPDWFEIWSQGQITGSADPGVMAYAAAHGLWTFALVQQNADPAVFQALLTHPAWAARARANLLRLVERYGFDGVNLDFEGIRPTDRSAFTRFVQRLSALFHAHGYYVTLSVPAETANEPGNAWTGAYDYRALGRAADLVMPMAYDDHYAGGPPGSVAPATWVAAVARYAVSVIPPRKVVLGVPGYGYDWGGGATALALSYGQASALDNRYRRGLAGSHFAYTAGGVVHEVYFSDAQSFVAQSRVAVDYNLRGVVVWRLGIEDPAIWRIVHP
jgi:spore germination protein YaaH